MSASTIAKSGSSAASTESETVNGDVNAVFEDGTLVDAALADAVREAILFHKRMENPIAVWSGGKVVWLTPDQIPANDH